MHEARLCAVWLQHSRYGCHGSVVGCKVRLSKMAADGCRLRPLASRKSKRTSSTMTAKQHAANQRLSSAEKQDTNAASRWASNARERRLVQSREHRSKLSTSCRLVDQHLPPTTART